MVLYNSYKETILIIFILIKNLVKTDHTFKEASGRFWSNQHMKIVFISGSHSKQLKVASLILSLASVLLIATNKHF